MSDFDEASIEEKDVGRVEGDTFGGTFPFDGAGVTTGITVLVYI